MDDRAYWMALAHLPAWHPERINRLIARILDERRLSFAEFFELDRGDWERDFGLSAEECLDIAEAGAGLRELASLVEELAGQGIEQIPIRSRAYPRILKKNLRPRYCPPLIYVRGNRRLLQESTVGILAVANAGESALQFAEAVAEKIARERRVLVAGLLKGMDRTGLEAALRSRGRGIIVAAQGLKTLAADLLEYQPQLIDGDVLAVSFLFPKLPWSSEQDLACTGKVLGLAEEVYVAESDSGGAIWSGAITALRSGRRIYVRKPQAGEENANGLLILRGAIPVDGQGEILPWESPSSGAPLRQLHFSDLRDGFESKLRRYFSLLKHPVSAREIKEHLKLSLSASRLSRLLKEMDFVQTSRGEDGSLLFGPKGGNERR